MTAGPGRFIATASQTVGPFFHFGLSTEPRLGCLVVPATSGDRIRLRVRVTDGQDEPVPDALVEIWQADADGEYVQGAPTGLGEVPTRFSGFGRLPTDADGRCEFETIRPGAVRARDGRPHAPHVHLCLFMRGLLRHIRTCIWFADDAALADDPVFAVIPSARQSTLLAQPVDAARTAWQFDIRLQGPRETVFFDL